MAARAALLGVGIVAFGAATGASPLRADDQSAKPAVAASVVVKPISSSSVTASGQPIVLPQGHVQVIASTYDIAPGAALPVHKHPFPRYAYVLAGTLDVTNDDIAKTETYRQGDFILEAVNQWHHAVNKGDVPVKLMVIDMVAKGKANVVVRK